MNYERTAKTIIPIGFVIIPVSMLLYLKKTTQLNFSLPIAPDIFASYGALVGGLVGPLFALAGVLLLLASIDRQKDAFIKQQIESRFFQLLGIFRENSNQVQIRSRSGQKVFVSLVRELNESFKIAKAVCQENKISDKDVPNIAYLAFFYGAVGPTSQSILHLRFSKKYSEEFLSALFARYEAHQDKCEPPFCYKPFEGHQSRLSHYYRHLFQAVSYIDDQPNDLLEYGKKYQYIKTLRAQLSNQEQLLFFWNSISELGQAWEKAPNIVDKNRMLITKYNLVKNLPEGCSKHLNVREFYPLVNYEGLNEPPNGRIELERLYR